MGFIGSIKEEESEELNSMGSSSSVKFDNESLLLNSSKDMSPVKKSFGFLSEFDGKKQSFESKKYFELEIESLLKAAL